MRYHILVIITLFFFPAGCGIKDPAAPANSVPADSSESAAIKENSEKPELRLDSTPSNKDAIESIYTPLSEDKCEDSEKDEEEEWSVQSCKGIGGYRLLVSEGDLRQTIDVVDPDEKKYELNLWQVVSSAFSTVGDKAEWRVIKKNGKPVPVALIVRYNVNEDPENTEKITSYLTVTKITRRGTCVTDIVKPIENANEHARKLADRAAEKPCLGTIVPMQ